MYVWQDEEQGQLCHKFAQFVESWEYNAEVKCLTYERGGRITLIDMSVDDKNFSFRKVGNRFSTLFDGEGEPIKRETFEFFESICSRFVKDMELLQE